SSARASTSAVSPPAALTLRLRGSGGAGLARERLLRHLGDAREALPIGAGQIAQHFAVEQRAGGLQAGDQAAVGEAVQVSGGVDAHDPQAADLPLLLPAVAVGAAERLVDGLLGDAVALRLGAVVAAGALEDLLPFLDAFATALDTCHLSNLVSAPRPVRRER